MPDEMHYLTIADAAARIARKELSAVELTQTLDPQRNAYLLVTAEQALEQARQAEQEIMAGNHRGPLHGIPFGLKDIYATAGIRTTSHSKICENLAPIEDATTLSQ